MWYDAWICAATVPLLLEIIFGLLTSSSSWMSKLNRASRIRMMHACLQYVVWMSRRYFEAARGVINESQWGPLAPFAHTLFTRFELFRDMLGKVWYQKCKWMTNRIKYFRITVLSKLNIALVVCCGLNPVKSIIPLKKNRLIPFLAKLPKISSHHLPSAKRSFPLPLSTSMWQSCSQSPKKISSTTYVFLPSHQIRAAPFIIYPSAFRL